MNFIAKMELQYCGVSQCTFLSFLSFSLLGPPARPR
jgi:hypothetical protein